MTSRERVAQGLPPADLAGFPCFRVETSGDLYRAHAASRGAWWFGSDGTGRFDLRPPRGTCYLALDPESAVRERIGPVLGRGDLVPESLLADVVVSRLRVPAPCELADLRSRGAARHGVTRELETMVPYAVPQAWAQAFDSAGVGGIRYGPRFTPGDASAVALFGQAGAADWDDDPDPVPAHQIPGAPRPLAAPRRADVTVVRPPRTRVARSQ